MPGARHCRAKPLKIDRDAMSLGVISKKLSSKKEGQRHIAVAPLSLVPIKIGVNLLAVSTPLGKLTPTGAASFPHLQRNDRLGRGLRHSLPNQAIDDPVRVPTCIVAEVRIDHCHLRALVTKAGLYDVERNAVLGQQTCVDVSAIMDPHRR